MRAALIAAFGVVVAACGGLPGRVVARGGPSFAAGTEVEPRGTGVTFILSIGCGSVSFGGDPLASGSGSVGFDLRIVGHDAEQGDAGVERRTIETGALAVEYARAIWASREEPAGRDRVVRWRAGGSLGGGKSYFGQKRDADRVSREWIYALHASVETATIQRTGGGRPVVFHAGVGADAAHVVSDRAGSTVVFTPYVEVGAEWPLR